MECENKQGCEQNCNLHQTGSETSILELNDHCLLKVLCYLDLVDTINLGKTCKKLQGASGMALPRFKHLRFLSDSFVDESVLPPGITVFDHGSVVRYVASTVESIDSSMSFDSLFNIPPESNYKFDFPKLKSLSLREVHHLKWISNLEMLEELEIHCLRESDLNNFAGDITKLKQLKLVSIEFDVLMDELSYFLESNPSIERLAFRDELVLTVPEDFFSKLKYLNHLELTLMCNFENLQHALQIDNLTGLVIDLRRSYCYNDVAIVAIETFLRNLAQKKTLRSLELRRMTFTDQVFDVLASFDLTSLRLITPIPHDNICSAIAVKSFHTLKTLDLLSPVVIDDIFNMIKHLIVIERMELSKVLDYDNDEFLKQLDRLLRGDICNRPELKLSTSIPFKVVKIFFNLRRYEMKDIVSWEST